MGNGDELDLFDEAFDGAIRRVWHNDRWYFSIIDVIGVLTDSPTPRRYWAELKGKLRDEGFGEVFAKSEQLKMLATDGKQRLTDAGDTETILRIIQSVPSPKAEPFKQWLARVGTERLQELEDPALAADRMCKRYEKLGYSDAWIRERLKNVVVRDELTAEWAERGADEGREFAILTDVLHHGTFDLTTAEHKKIKRLSAKRPLRDSMTSLELVLISLAEVTAAELHQVHDSHGFDELQGDASTAGNVAGNARREIEAQTQRPVVSPENYKSLQQGRQRELQPPLMDDEEVSK